MLGFVPQNRILSKMKKRIRDRLAVCSWSLQPASPSDLIEKMRIVGMRRIQCALDPMRSLPEIWVNFSQQLTQAKMDLVSGMFGCVGEDYTSMESIRRTGGIVPDETWDENWENLQSVADIAKKLKLKLVTFHAGFLPHDRIDPAYETMLHRMRLVAGTFAARGINLALETGQETAETLSRFLEDLGRPNVGVNFDPANMILYDKGDPIEALLTLGPWLRQCHLKDAKKTKVSGTWGEEVPVGTGDVDWSQFFKTLADLNFKGPLCFEREAGDQRMADIHAGRDFVEGLEKQERASKPVDSPAESSKPSEQRAGLEPVIQPGHEETIELTTRPDAETVAESIEAPHPDPKPDESTGFSAEISTRESQETGGVEPRNND